MAGIADPGFWEQSLDQELAQRAEPTVADDPGALAGALNAPGDTPAPAGRSVEVVQLRREFLESVRAGMTLSDDIFTEDGILLLSAGSRITTRFLAILQKRGITCLRLCPPRDKSEPSEPDPFEAFSAPAPLETPFSRILDDRSAGELQKLVSYHPVMKWRRPRLPVDDLKHQAAIGVETHAATCAVVAEISAALHTGRRMSAAALRQSIARFVTMAALDFDLLPLIVAMKQSHDEYLFDHCVSVSLLSMAMGTQLGLDRETVAVLGLGGMLQDIGMLRVPSSIRLAEQGIGEREWHEIHRHPLHSLDMLSNLGSIPTAVKFIAYHAHERIDGGGYPHGRSGNQLHEYAKIVALADVYTAMTTDRPYRAACPPYTATKTILAQGAKGIFDRSLVRAFLDTVALFPIGSRVTLSTGTHARVLRANPGLHTRPVVEELAGEGVLTGRIVDLSDESAPTVVRVA